MAESCSIRLLNDPSLDGPTNMARDEALLEFVGRSRSSPTLRLYQWIHPTISLGYFQAYAEYQALPPPAGTLPVVRRLTGGGAILHDRELTYSLVLPMDHALLRHGTNRLYELAHQAVVECLERLGLPAAPCGQSDDSGAARGPFFCFERRHRYDVLTGNEKIAGSAQRRRRDAVLQHGSIILANRYGQQRTAVIAVPYEDAVRDTRRRFPECFAHLADIELVLGEWTPQEHAAAQELIARYAGDAWTRRT